MDIDVLDANLSSVFDKIKGTFSKKYKEQLIKNTIEYNKDITEFAEKTFRESWNSANYHLNGGYDSHIKLDVERREVKSSTSYECNTRLVAKGKSVSMIEFGTGVYYGGGHPWASEHGITMGSYGKGKGNNPEGWYFTTNERVDVGLKGTYIVKNKKTGKLKYGANGYTYHTLGVPAQMPTFLASMDITKYIEEKSANK